MAHPTHHIKADVAELQKQVAELRARLGIKDDELPEATRTPGLQPGCTIDFSGNVRNGRGEIYVDPNLPSYEERQAKVRAEAEAKQAAERKAMTAGCHEGTYRDASNMIRLINGGALVSHVVLAQMEREAVERVQADAHRAYKIHVGLPVHPVAPSEDED
jgi:hypothetical protein